MPGKLYRLIGVSDLHGKHGAARAVRKASLELGCDLILVAGDVAGGEEEEALKLLEEMVTNDVKIVYVPGNFDAKALIDKELRNVYSAHGKCLNLNGVNVIGLGGSPKTPFFSPFDWMESEAAEILKTCYKGCDSGRLIVLSHAPPHETRVDETSTGLHVGSLSLRRFIEEVQPSLVVCGHVHEARGVDILGYTMIVNPGPGYRGFYAYIEWKSNGKPHVKLSRFESF
jgi:Icc-related predicted phosphoesterase